MADILFGFNNSKSVLENQNKAEDLHYINLGQQYGCKIFGKDGTYNIIRDGMDVIISIGYVCWIDGNSVQDTLSQILNYFKESQIGDLKKRLIGEYILLVKKGTSIYIFSDFMGVRNIFYSHDGMIVSSSFVRIEDMVKTRERDFDIYKFLEFLAMRHMFYPAWLGDLTYHKRIKWLLPSEYLVIDVEDSRFRVGSVVYSIDNRKQTDCAILSNELISILIKIVARKEFAHLKVAALLTGGHDSRLIAAIANNEFPDIHFRTAVSLDNPNSLRDLKVASKVARVQRVPLDVFCFQPRRDKERFFELTEGLSPAFNHLMTPVIDAAGAYSLGFGGAFGTELFEPIPWNSFDAFFQERIKRAKRALKAEDGFWKYFQDSIYEVFRKIKENYVLSIYDERDYMRIFCLVNTARYGSFILSAFNCLGLQLDPYSNYAIFELAIRVSPNLWGNEKRIGGIALVQKAAMGRLNPNLGRVMAYMHFRPMLPLTVRTCPKYLVGYALQIGHRLKERYASRKKKLQKINLPGSCYLSDGWETYYITRTIKKYGMAFSPKK
jgi:hypothetical protein